MIPKLRDVLSLPKDDGLTIQPVPSPEQEAPLRPTSRWIRATGGSLFKRYCFLDNVERNRFVNEVLEYEQEMGHAATIKIVDKEVMIALITKDLNVPTELDKEYADTADLIFRDIVSV